MNGARFTEEQIIAVLKEGEAGLAVGEGRRKHGVMGQDIYFMHIRLVPEWCIGKNAFEGFYGGLFLRMQAISRIHFVDLHVIIQGGCAGSHCAGGNTVFGLRGQ